MFFKREQLAAVAAIANHQRLPIPIAPVVDDPDVNVVDLDDGIEREEKSTSGTTSVSCQESFNSDQRYSPSTQTDILYSKSPNVVPELDPPKCVVCMVRHFIFDSLINSYFSSSKNRMFQSMSFMNNTRSFCFSFVFIVSICCV